MGVAHFSSQLYDECKLLVGRLQSRAPSHKRKCSKIEDYLLRELKDMHTLNVSSPFSFNRGFEANLRVKAESCSRLFS
jgi:hypothetical protein